MEEQRSQELQVQASRRSLGQLLDSLLNRSPADLGTHQLMVWLSAVCKGFLGSTRRQNCELYSHFTDTAGTQGHGSRQRWYS